jgi:hypothetical protein
MTRLSIEETGQEKQRPAPFAPKLIGPPNVPFYLVLVKVRVER